MRPRRFLSKHRVVMVWVNDIANRCRLSSNGRSGGKKHPSGTRKL